MEANAVNELPSLSSILYPDNPLRRLLISLLSIVPMLAAALTLTVEPGEFASSLPGLAGQSVVTVKGQVNVADLAFLVDSVPAGATLDLGDAAIVAYDGEPVAHGLAKAAADELPPYILAGLRASRLVLPAGLKAIGAGALLDAEITAIEIPSGVKVLGEHSFAACRKLTEVTFAPGCTLARIPSRAFDGCVLLEAIDVPESVTAIDARAFAGCNSLSSFRYPSQLESIGEEAFAASGIAGASLSECSRLRHIGARAWAECTALTSGSLPTAAALGGDAVFMGCPLLTEVTLPASASSLPDLTLAGASALGSIVLPEGTDSIGVLALAGAADIRELTLPASLAHIDQGAFEGWKSLGEVDARAIEKGVPTLGECVWAGVDQAQVILRVAEPLEQAYLNADQWRDFSITTSAIRELPAEGTPGTDPIIVSASFADRVLTVSSDAPIASVSVYALDGATVTVRTGATADARMVRVNTSQLSGSVFVVSVHSAEGSDSPVIFKILRR